MKNISFLTGIRRQIPFIVLGVFIVSCSSMIAVFDQQAYLNATTLKAEASTLMDQAVEPYIDHSESVKFFMTRIDAAYEYARGIPRNEESAKQWEILKNPEGNLLGGFFKLWKKNGTLMRGDIEAIKKNTLEGFDKIIRLEAAKIKK